MNKTLVCTALFAALGGLHGAKGRLDLVGTVAGAPVLVDYAHKPGAVIATRGAFMLKAELGKGEAEH